MSVSVGSLPPSLAMDGKMVRDRAGILNVSDAALNIDKTLLASAAPFRFDALVPVSRRLKR